MRSVLLAIALLAPAAAPATAAEDPATGKYLLETCRKAMETRSPDRWNRDFCVGFVSGYVDGHARGAASDSPAFCLPEDATTGKLISAVVRYLESHPESLGLPRGEALAAALADRYPCRGEADPSTNAE